VLDAIGHDFEANVFTFSVAIEPKDQVVAAFGFTLEVFAYSSFGVGLVFDSWGVEEICWVGLAPVLISRGKVNAVDMAYDGCHFEPGRLSLKYSIPEVDV
jgi:hypothetical protein